MNDQTNLASGRGKRVVIVGAGFGGIAAAKALADAPVEVTIIDRHNHHLFQPLLYQVATAGLNPSDIAQPVRYILAKQANCHPVLADVTGVDTAEQCVDTTVGPIPYDFLILATGATHAYFGNDQWASHAPGLKTIEDALDIRGWSVTVEDNAGATSSTLTFTNDPILSNLRSRSFRRTLR